MKGLKLMILAAIALAASSCATIYKNSNLDRESSNLQTMAIVPFNVYIKAPKSTKNRSIELDVKTQLDEGLRLQNEVYTRLLQKNTLLNVSIQDISLTNAKIAEAGFTPGNLKSISKDKLAELLGVDMVLSGDIFQKKPMTTGGAIAIGVATTIVTPVGLILPFVIPINEVNMDVNLHKKKESILMWKYHHTLSGGVSSTPENIGNIMVKEVVQKFPFIKKKKDMKKN